MNELEQELIELNIDYERDMDIDEDAIDLELLNQSKLEARYIKAVSIAFRIKSYLHEELKTRRSELVAKANKKPKICCNKDKPNAGDIEAFYRRDKKYKQIKEELIEAEDRYNVLNGMKDDIHFTRTKALDNIVELMNMEYFSGPAVPRNLKKERGNWKKEKMNKQIGSGMKRRRKKK